MTNTVTIQSQPTGPEGPNDDAYVKLVDDAQAKLAGTNGDASPEAVQEGERPSWLPEKFKSPEEFAKSYAELETRLGQQSQSKEQAPEQTTQEQAQQAVESAGLDWSSLESEFAQNGGLTDESYAKLEKAGIPRDKVDAFIAGQQAIAERQVNEVVSTVGGKDAYQEIVQWAAKALTPDEIAAFNKVVDSGDLGQLKLAVQGLKARFDTSNGVEPKATLRGDSGATQSGGVYASLAEMQRDMTDPRYASDPAFRQRVADKLARSNIL